ncbi:MAG: LysR family transcriptional regulator [Zoogloeaceae bacterium]|nr:LysR family transcriptional regulator [Zoogloeaceae bacterium]
MELYHLRTFVTVAEEGHLTRASERLFTSQPAVSAHIKALEEELGVTLFERTPRVCN